MDILKHELLMEISEGIEHAVSNVILFQYREKDTGFASHSVIIPRKQWSDLGCPMEVTVSIVPGNHLGEKEVPLTLESKERIGSARVRQTAEGLQVTATLDPEHAHLLSGAAKGPFSLGQG